MAALPVQAYANYGTWAIDVHVHGKKIFNTIMI